MKKERREEIISMFLGLLIVAVAAGLIFNYFQKRRGTVNVPGISDVKKEQLTETPTTVTGKGKYTVVKGDSLWKIAQKRYNNGYKWVDIAKANNLKRPGLLAAGQKLILPEATVGEQTLPPVKIESGSYKVVRNDNLWNICVKVYGDGFRWTEVWKNNKNKLRDPNKLEIGMILIMPQLK